MNGDIGQIKSFADNIWSYIEPKIDKKLADGVRYYKASVVQNPRDGKIKIQRPFEDSQIELPCAASAASLKAGDQCLILVFGSASNSYVVGKADFTA